MLSVVHRTCNMNFKSNYMVILLLCCYVFLFENWSRVVKNHPFIAGFGVYSSLNFSFFFHKEDNSQKGKYIYIYFTMHYMPTWTSSWKKILTMSAIQ